MLRDGMRRLQVAFRLAEADFARLDAPSRERLKADIGKFLRSTGAKAGAETGGVWVGSRLPKDVSDREVGELCSTVRRILDALVHGRPLDFPAVPRLALVLAPVAASKDVVVTVVDGQVGHRFVLALMLLLAHVGAARVRACPACGGAFLKSGRRTHCQRPECRRRRASEYWHRYKNTPAGRRAQLRLRQHLYDTVYAEHGWTPRARSKKSSRLTKKGAR